MEDELAQAHPFEKSITIDCLSEGQIIGACLPFFSAGSATIIPSGDDAAVLAAPLQRYVITTDMLVEHSHFRCDWSTAYDIGSRAAAQNLADVVAMGATPHGLVVALALPRNLSANWVTECAYGIAQYCQNYNCEVVGGDMTTHGDNSSPIVISITATGIPLNDKLTLRNQAQPGDVVALAGSLGLSRAGLELYQQDCYLSGDNRVVTPSVPIHAKSIIVADNLTTTTRLGAEACQRIYRSPQPPLHDVLQALTSSDMSSWNAMMDVSDGLVLDAQRMASASSVQIHLDTALLTQHVDALMPIFQDRTMCTDFVLTGGEDHSFLATFAQTIPSCFHPIGHVRSGSAGVFIDGKPFEGVGGWDHGSGRDRPSASKGFALPFKDDNHL